jgi:hypothetical protein
MAHRMALISPLLPVRLHPCSNDPTSNAVWGYGSISPIIGVMMIRHVRALGLIGAVALMPVSVSAESGAIAASTRLHRCGDQTCLLIRGRRADPAASVLVQEHEVSVAGRRRWHVSLPLQTVQDWSPPFARSILVEIAGNDGGTGRAKLPIGVFGHTTDLAFLNVSARR